MAITSPLSSVSSWIFVSLIITMMSMVAYFMMLSSLSSDSSAHNTLRALRRKLLFDPRSIEDRPASFEQVAQDEAEMENKPNFFEQAAQSEAEMKAQEAEILDIINRPLYNENIADPWKKELFERLDRIRSKCGVLCTINDQDTLHRYSTPASDSTFGIQVKVPQTESYCSTILMDEDVDAGDSSLPFPAPAELTPYYSMSGMVDYDATWNRMNNIFLGGDQTLSSTWTVELINEYIENCKKGMPYEGYGKETMTMLESIKEHTDIEEGGKHVLVLGTERPWLEAVVLYLGAEHVTTWEHEKIDSQHPQITTVTPNEFRELYSSDKIPQYDIIVSFSSIEHNGLGRYGDALNPWGDILSIQRAKCVTKKGGYLVLAVPTQKQYGDFLQFNAHRLYGKHRYPVLTAGWKQIDADDHPAELEVYMETPAFVFQKI